MTRDLLARLTWPQVAALSLAAAFVLAPIVGGVLYVVRSAWLSWRDRRWLWSGRYRPDDVDALAERAERIDRTINASARQEPR